MSLGSVIAATLPRLRAEAESLQTVNVRVVAIGTLQDAVPDPDTGIVTPAETIIYTGLARVKPLTRVTNSAANAGEARDSAAIYVVSLPWSTTGCEPGQVVRVMSANDTELVTETFRVVDVDDGDDLTARRMACELVERRSP